MFAPILFAVASSFAAETDNDVFTPLLAPYAPRVVTSRSSNISHGSLQLWNLYHSVNQPESHYWTGRAVSDGSVERLGGSPWSFVWAGNVSYRDGNVSSVSTDFRDPKLYLRRFMFSRKGEKEGFTRLGRLAPVELPSLGYLDGIQLETVASPTFRVGAAAGARPDRKDMSVSGDEVMGSAYATAHAGTRGNMYYTGTLGFLQTLYKGEADELALLYDQRADLTRFMNLFVSAKLNFDSGGAVLDRGPRFTQLNLYGLSPVTPFLQLRGGMSHYERPDTRAERAAGGPDNFTSGSWRYWVGGSEKLPWGLRADGDVSFFQSPESLSPTLWRISLSRQGLLELRGALLTASWFNLSDAEGDGYGGGLSGDLPFWEGKLMARLNWNFRYSGRPNDVKKWKNNDESARLTWRLSRQWDLDTGATFSTQEHVHVTTMDLGIRYHW